MDRHFGDQFPYAALFWPALAAMSAAETASSMAAQFLGLEQDVNRSTAAEMSEMAFRSAIVPTARLVAEYLTRDAIGKKLGWTDLEFVFTDVDAQDEMTQAQIDEILLRNGVVTVAEVRRARGLAEIL